MSCSGIRIINRTVPLADTTSLTCYSTVPIEITLEYTDQCTDVFSLTSTHTPLKGGSAHKDHNSPLHNPSFPPLPPFSLITELLSQCSVYVHITYRQ